MFIVAAPSLLQATRIAILLWTLASNGNTTFQEAESCAPHEAKGEACMSLFPTKSLPAPYAGKTWRYRNQYVSLVTDANPAIIVHEIAHAILGMSYHSAPRTSLMSPALGSKCFTQEDAARYEYLYGKPMTPWCLP